MTDYTPTTEELKAAWIAEKCHCFMGDEGECIGRTSFDRWLAAHDAAIRANEREQVIRRLIYGDNSLFMGFYGEGKSENGWIDGQLSELFRSIRNSANEEKRYE